MSRAGGKFGSTKTDVMPIGIDKFMMAFIAMAMSARLYFYAIGTDRICVRELGCA